MFAYCGNNPVSRADDGGEFWEILAGAAIGGAIAGALIGAVSYAVSCGINGEDVTAAGLLGAGANGAISGAIGAIGGVLGGGYAVAASVGVGLFNGIVTAVNTEGSVEQKVISGLTTGVISGFGTYLGTRIPVANGNFFEIAFTSFTGGLWLGTQTEIVNVAVQQSISNARSSIAGSSANALPIVRNRPQKAMIIC